MNIDMRIRHGDTSRGKGCLQTVEDVIVAGPVILRAGPEAQDVIDRAVAVAGDVGLDGPVFEDLLMRGRGLREHGADGVRRVVIRGRDVQVDPARRLGGLVDDGGRGDLAVGQVDALTVICPQARIPLCW